MDRSLGDERLDYDAATLVESAAPPEPMSLVRAWLQAAQDDPAIPEPTAMVLSTVVLGVGEPRPRARVVLCKDVTAEGFVFYTNRQSDKGRELELQSEAALTFWWQPHYRSVRIEGGVEQVSDADSDAYFATRPRGSQLGAHASAQSRPIAGPDEIAAAQQAAERRFEGREVPRPPHWGGYLVRPDVVEFWQGRPNRLHDRLRYTRQGAGWARVRLQP